MNATKKCPMCAEEIEDESLVCRYCGAKFDVKRKGYCQNCHMLREVNEINQCKVCGNAAIDVHVVSTLIEEATNNPTITSESATQPENKPSGAKKAAAILGVIAFSLLCGFPGVFSLILGGASLFGLLAPGAPQDMLAETLAQNQISRQQMFNYSLVFIGVGILLILIPIVFGTASLRNKKPASQSPKRSWGGILARLAAFLIILTGLVFIVVKVGMPKLNLSLADPIATNVPIKADIKALNIQSPPGETYADAQQLADVIIEDSVNCTFKSANMNDVPIYDIGECWFAEEDRGELGNRLTIWIERIEEYALDRAANDGITISESDITQLIQKTRGANWDAYRGTISATSDADWQKVLVGPKWQITGKLSALIKIQNIIGGDILDYLSDADREFYVNR